MLTDLTIKKVYNSESDNLLEDFYIPVLKTSVNYKRITGYFSSISLALAARGIAHFFSNGGIYQLISGVVVSEPDYQALKNGTLQANDFILNQISFDPSLLKEEIDKDHLKVMAWLIFEKRMQIKIAVLPSTSRGIFHEKVGIFEDENGNNVSFSGSINETGAGWINNMEEFKVFRSWIDGEREYLERDKNKFLNYWQDNVKNFTVIDLPKAIEQEILKIKPDDNEIQQVLKKLKNQNQSSGKSLRPYQNEAIDKWVNNDFKGIFEMATGTGKTLTALGAANKINELFSEYCVLIVVPYKHLVTQWKKDIQIQLNPSLIVEAHGGAVGWRKKISQFLSDYNDGFLKKIVVLTTYDTLSSKDFLDIFLKKFSSQHEYLIIADEVHNFGAPEYGKGMIKEIDKRLGLSATPTRWFDEVGTNSLIDYFEETVYKYDMKMAIENKILTEYEYFPLFVQMTNDEFDKYFELSKKILKNLRIQDSKYEDYLKILRLERSKIVKNSTAKLESLHIILEELKNKKSIDHLLIYCDSGGQLNEVQKIVNKLGIISHKFTEKESLKDREKILRDFDEGIYECLIAVKCLDEGVDVPSTKTAIILASSTNPREYIQRRGRVLRRYPGKDKAVIYDYTVLPPEEITDKELFKTEQQILKKELTRTQEFLDTASNKTFILQHLSDIMLRFSVYLD